MEYLSSVLAIVKSSKCDFIGVLFIGDLNEEL